MKCHERHGLQSVTSFTSTTYDLFSLTSFVRGGNLITVILCPSDCPSGPRVGFTIYGSPPDSSPRTTRHAPYNSTSLRLYRRHEPIQCREEMLWLSVSKLRLR